MKRIPVEIKHEWKPRPGYRGVYECKPCDMWTANMPLYRNEVCPAKDRRNVIRDRRVSRTQPNPQTETVGVRS